MPVAPPTPLEPYTRSREESLRVQAEGAADVKSALNAIGISDEHGWLIASIVYGAGGGCVFLMSLFGLVPFALQITGLIAITVALICAYGIKHWRNGPPQEHLRTSFGLVLIFVGVQFAGGMAPAMMPLTLLAFVTPCYLYGPRFALPYAVAILTGVGFEMFTAPGPQSVARGVVFCGLLLVVMVAMLISEMQTRALARQNRWLAYTDPLTGVANMRRLREDIAATLKSGELEKRDFALYSIDLDNFKMVNDIFDHGLGDRVLQAVASELASELQPGDLVARRGGDEFSVLILQPEARGVDLDRLTTRLGRAINRARMEICPQVTPTGGVAFVRASAEDDLPTLLRRADDELHRVKEEHRRVTGSRRRSSDKTARTETAEPSVSGERRQHGIAARAFAWVNPTRARGSSWVLMGDMMLPVALVGAILAAGGMLRPLSPLVGLALSAGLFAIAVNCLVAAHRGFSLRLLHVAFPAMIAIVAAQIALAGPAGSAYVDTLCLLMFAGVFAFKPKAAIGYVLACAALYWALSIAGGYPDALVRSATTTVSFLAVLGTVMQVRAITIQFARTNLELSQIDALTGLANLRALKLRLRTEVEKAQHGERRPMLVSLDLVNFKSVNDVYNHTTGDETLRAVADALSRSIRATDFVARRGGDEFVVIGDFPDEAAAAKMVQRLQDTIAEARSRICPDLNSGVRIGWTVWDEGDGVEELLAKSNGTLHTTKMTAQSAALNFPS